MTKLIELGLDLEGRNIGIAGGIVIGEMLSNLVNLTKLSLVLSSSLIENKGVIEIVENMNDNLIYLGLDLRQNNIDKEGGSEIGNYVKKLINLSNLELDLGQNNIDDEGGSIIV